MFWRTKKVAKRRPPAVRRLRAEAFESRHMLSGVVNVVIAPVGAAGTLTLLGDNAGNQVELQADPTNPGTFIISGTNNTLLQVNGGGVTVQSQTVNGINLDINVQLGHGSNTFDFEGPTGGGTSTAPADLDIVNLGTDTNILNNVTVIGNLNVTKAPGNFGLSTLTISNSTVQGDTVVNNIDGGASGGSSFTTLINSSLQGGGPTHTALTLVNNGGDAELSVQGTTLLGASAFGVVPPAQPEVVVVNGDGGGKSIFTGATTVYGGLTIVNGDSLPGQTETVSFNGTNVLGPTNIADGTGAAHFSNTRLIVTNSNLGTKLATVAGPTPAPVIVQNNAGFDSLNMSGSQLPWGLAVNNDLNAAGASNWGSTTSITSSSIGTRIGGPSLPVAGDALQIIGDNGPDVVNVATSTIGGELDLGALRGGNNSVTLDSNTMGSLVVVTGAGNDFLKIAGGVIQQSIFVNLGGGQDTMQLRHGTTPINGSTIPVMPDPLLGALFVEGGTGVDTFLSDADLASIVSTLHPLDFETFGN